jgi:hexokinase
VSVITNIFSEKNCQKAIGNVVTGAVAEPTTKKPKKNKNTNCIGECTFAISFVFSFITNNCSIESSALAGDVKHLGLINQVKLSVGEAYIAEVLR